MFPQALLGNTEKSDDVPAESSKSLIIHGTESAVRNYSAFPLAAGSQSSEDRASGDSTNPAS
jgi:hypothetical protein